MPKLTLEEIEDELGKLNLQRHELQSELRAVFDRQNFLFKAGKRAGATIAGMARWSGSHEQHIRDVINGANSYRKRRGRTKDQVDTG
jgi:hypothetical protein